MLPITHITTTGNRDFAVSLLMANKVVAVSSQIADDKDLANDKEEACRQLVLCHPLVDGKDTGGPSGERLL